MTDWIWKQGQTAKPDRTALEQAAQDYASRRSLSPEDETTWRRLCSPSAIRDVLAELRASQRESLTLSEALDASIDDYNRMKQTVELERERFAQETLARSAAEAEAARLREQEQALCADVDTLQRQAQALQGELAEVKAEGHALSFDADKLWAERDAAREALRRAKEKATTVFVAAEWSAATDWRERFLDAAGEHEIAPLDQQLVCYAVFDAMTFRDVHDINEAALGQPTEPQQ